MIRNCCLDRLLIVGPLHACQAIFKLMSETNIHRDQHGDTLMSCQVHNYIRHLLLSLGLQPSSSTSNDTPAADGIVNALVDFRSQVNRTAVQSALAWLHVRSRSETKLAGLCLNK
eukprot:TRINITY_DN10179_c0_g1_i3.p2 TRINITY_DN10179_c0_g1~~TRINITY_DN10179_c0_g1_i3.p2  ORF type:complete len:115 (+),score=3.88 TRINITY_DN10179_c0_g1_i3:797-1141(+)